jgi:hypothetical protein
MQTYEEQSDEEYGDWSKEGRDFQVLAFITTKAPVRRTESGLCHSHRCR